MKGMDASFCIDCHHSTCFSLTELLIAAEHKVFFIKIKRRKFNYDSTSIFKTVNTFCIRQYHIIEKKSVI
jgi:hypothetical protein